MRRFVIKLVLTLDVKRPPHAAWLGRLPRRPNRSFFFSYQNATQQHPLFAVATTGKTDKTFLIAEPMRKVS